MREFSGAIGCLGLFIICLSGCDETTRQPEWGIYDGPACGAEGTTAPWTTMGGIPGSTFRSKASGPTDPELRWSRSLGPVRALADDPRIFASAVNVPWGVDYRVSHAVVSGSGALYTLSVVRETPAEPTTASLQVEQFGPGGARGWTQKIPIDGQGMRPVATGPARSGVLALTDDCTLAVRTPYRIQVLDPSTGDIRTSHEIPRPQGGPERDAATQMRLLPWNDDGFLTTTTSVFGLGSAEVQYRMRFSRIPSRDHMEGSQRYESHISELDGTPAPVLAQPSEGRAYIHNPKGQSEAAAAIGSVQTSAEEPGDIRPLWKTSLEEEFSDLYLLGATASSVYLSARKDDVRPAYHVVSLNAEDGRTEWDRAYGDLPGDAYSKPGVKTVFDPNGRPILAFEGAIVAMTDDGDVRWAYEVSNDFEYEETRFTTMAVGSEGRVYAVSGPRTAAVFHNETEFQIQALDATGEKLFSLDVPDPWTAPRILALGADGTLYVEAVKVRGEGDDRQVQSKLFAFGDAN